MSERELDGESVDVLVDLRWDDYNASLFVEKLFRHVRRGELRFDLEVRAGSVESTFALGVTPDLTVEVIESVARYLLERTRRADRDLAEPELIVFVDGEGRTVTVSDEHDIRTIVERAHEIVRDEDQRDLDDFAR